MISVRGLAKSHGGTPVLRGVDLDVAQGEVAVLIGPSGGGKSTLLRCLNGLEAFEAGSVSVGEVRLGPGGTVSGGSLLDLRRTLGMVFQQFHLFPHWTALENVAAGPRFVLGLGREEAEARARPLLERVGLGDRLGARPDQLSGGQQQRVAIARALDPRMAAEVTAVMADLARAGQTMVVVTHAMGFAREAAGTVHVMQGGRVIESGPPAQVFGNPREAATREFLTHI